MNLLTSCRLVLLWRTLLSPRPWWFFDIAWILAPIQSSTLRLSLSPLWISSSRVTKLRPTCLPLLSPSPPPWSVNYFKEAQSKLKIISALVSILFSICSLFGSIKGMIICAVLLVVFSISIWLQPESKAFLNFKVLCLSDLGNLSTEKQADGQFYLSLRSKSRPVSLDRLFSAPYLRQEGRTGLKSRKQNLWQVLWQVPRKDTVLLGNLSHDLFSVFYFCSAFCLKYGLIKPV